MVHVDHGLTLKTREKQNTDAVILYDVKDVEQESTNTTSLENYVIKETITVLPTEANGKCPIF